ncbi:hypothetical protein SAMN05216251_1366 [Actinacidiphila alni]|uniref:Uncharacterized protein n=1 Tax=Actinacidiphila alni TaxID=380248 RepID=A0A1I2MGY8_9ACTN|nr:hypothetical protein [Actinacidiphila alni]SFF90742.1 hypothetical protein SAMN05216251_1366 [Actinacidiphila alni]
MTPAASAVAVTAMVHTAAILPGCAVHSRGALLTSGVPLADAIRTAWHSGHRLSAERETPLVLRVATPDGRIEARAIRGWQRPVPEPVTGHQPVDHPAWLDPVPDRAGLLRPIRAAQRSGQPAAAAAAAGVLAGALRAELGAHPHTALAAELQAQAAADARMWTRAARLHTEAAALHHQLGAPGDREAACVRGAVTAWVRASAHPSRTTAETVACGFTLAHTLIGLCPHTDELAAVLRRLAEYIPPTDSRTEPETSR